MPGAASGSTKEGAFNPPKGLGTLGIITPKVVGQAAAPAVQALCFNSSLFQLPSSPPKKGCFFSTAVQIWLLSELYIGEISVMNRIYYGIRTRRVN